jgi:hypothetical protein
MLGEFLYQLTAKDAITQPVMQRKVEQLGLAAAALTVDADFEVIPQDRVAILTNLFVIATAGAAQLVTDVRATVRQSTTQIAGINYKPSGLVADGFGYDCQYLLWPGEFVRIRGTFDAAVDTNIISASIQLVYIPKGNLQLR